MILSIDYNNFMLKNYVFITKEEIDNKFIKDKNNFVYNLGTLNITSGKIAIFNPLSVDDMDTVIDEEEVLDRTVEIGKYNVLLAMRKTDYGTYITGVKIVFKPGVVEKYELAATTSSKTEFVVTQYYSGICDFDTLEKYNNIFQSFKYLPQKENKLIKSGAQTRIGIQKILHFFRISRYNHNQIIPIIFHCLQKCINGFLTEIIFPLIGT